MQCWQCGEYVRPGERTCGNCGARLTSPPDSRSQRPSQQRYPSPRSAPRRPREDDWESDRGDESGYGPAFDYDPDDRRGEQRGARGGAEDGWEDSRADWRREQRSRPRGRQESQNRGGGYPPDGFDQSGVYDDVSQEYSAQQPPDPRDDPLNDPRAPRSLRSSPQRGPDSRTRFPQDDPARGRHEEGGYRGQHQSYPQDSYAGYDGYDEYAEPGRSRRSQPSSADNRYGRASGSRSQPAPYDDGYSGGPYGESYRPRERAPRQEYGRDMPPDDESSWYHQVGSRARALQQRWGETFGSVRIPGVRSQDERDQGKSSPGRIVTTIVVVLVLVTAVVAGAIVFAPRVLNRLNPSGTTSSSLCTASGPATTGTQPAAGANEKQFVSSRSKYGVNYPETWTVEPQQKVASGYDYIDIYTLPNASTSVSIEQAQAACALSDTNIIQGEVAAAQQQNISFTENTSAARTQTIGGEQWQRREYDVSDKGVSLHMVILACHHQGRAYVIVLVSRTTTFSQDNTGIFEPMLKSFTFTN